ncbi:MULTISPECIES: oxygen-independent coproporphyrinogen III oxidase [unclassified Rhizobacter]|uniref:oxygen-independent coproporphyrinogen III oxidase n=1 Tax=unclassified Rhizobacter TaxID=2640088 RepID=UPI0006FD99FF|nr:MULTISPECIES: oxygen-independent coproporphyrinogen III oxidase [unclassified Rhizobacter]KQU67343.1 coproporphyrinogen III oxidase [Rhizobacter sp. Root29]KQW14680.1 coproporphyrinogen III oxidase [Rhizobacter sp. Root1238]KRB24023.1 coproporphyrinogen III oxidase [Rhizobacter sp. Root16D2]
MASATSSLPLDDDLLRRFDVPGPRYTSYPTADRFGEAFDAPAYQRTLLARGASGAPLSLYVHIPFCESVCYYCACNKVITRHHERAVEYLDALAVEIDLHVTALGTGLPVSQLHLGGGSPTFLNDAELTRLMSTLRAAFRLLPDAEISIEVDPRTVTPARLAHVRTLGFNRISFGVQDIQPDVQQAVHRVQPFEDVRVLVAAARVQGYESINVDLIYGLPKQTPQSMAETVARVAELRPDRVALYGYAHLPERFKPQRRIVTAELPGGADRVAMLRGAIHGFLAAGYEDIGMDHFALPGDALARARRAGRLHRNFQGYSTQPDCDLVALGVSAIGRMGASYSQNAKTLPEYYEALAQRRFPVVRGLALDADDLLRRDVIMALMCQGSVDLAALGLSHQVDGKAYFAPELASLQVFVADGLVEIENGATVRVTPRGWLLVRAIAMVFDRHLQAARARMREGGRTTSTGARFSRVL